MIAHRVTVATVVTAEDVVVTATAIALRATTDACVTAIPTARKAADESLARWHSSID